MRDMMESILKNSDTVLGVEWKSGPNSSELLLEQEDGRGRMVFHPLFPGVTLAFIQVSASNWPESEANAELRPLLINYCVAGRSELLLDDGAYIYLKENDFAVSEQTAQDGYIFPTRLYQGIKIYFDIEQLSQNAQELMSAFELDFTLLRENYCRRQKTYINEADSTLTAIFRKLWALSEQPSLFYLRIYTLELIYELLHTEPRPSKTCGFYTELQVGIAKKAEQILTADLRKHIPVRLLAEKFSVGETSLKNYFRGVYGQNISTYLREVRMKAAAEFLANTSRPIAEIAEQVGYSNLEKLCEDILNDMDTYDSIQEAIRHVPVGVPARTEAGHTLGAASHKISTDP